MELRARVEAAPGLLEAGQRALLGARADGVLHRDLAGDELPVVREPGVVVAGVPEPDVAVEPGLECGARGRGHHHTSMPPATLRATPVTFCAAARKSTACATSAGVCSRPSGTMRSMAARYAASPPRSGEARCACHMCVPRMPGQTAFTRTPCPASSIASACVRPTTANLLAQ